MDWPYPEDFLADFIGLYETMPSLWDPRSKEYRSREIRMTDTNNLLEKFKEVEPEATKTYLLKKMCLLRRQYRNEKRRSTEQGRPIRKRFECLRFLPDPPSVKREKLSKDPLDGESTSEDEKMMILPTEFLEDIKPTQPLKTYEVQTQVDHSTDNLDRFDYVTKAWTESLQIMPRHQQIIAERIINNVLFEAQVGNLSTRSPIEVSKLLHTNW